MGTHLRVLSESFPMNNNMTRLDGFQKICVLVLWTKEASALEGLRFASQFLLEIYLVMYVYYA